MPKSFVLKNVENGFYFDQSQRMHHALTMARVFDDLPTACEKIRELVPTGQHFFAVEVTPMTLVEA